MRWVRRKGELLVRSWSEFRWRLDDRLTDTLYPPRRELYQKGGLVSVTSRILIVDLLQRDLPAEIITGLVVLHAERYKYLRPSINMFRK